MWHKLLQEWNGISMFYNQVGVTTTDLKVWTDSSSSFGFGGYYQAIEEAFSDTWINHPLLSVTEQAMSYLELYPIVASCIMWGKHWRKRRMIFMCDNEGTVAILNKGRSRCKEINKLMRRLAVVATKYNFIFSSHWFSTKANVEADLLSRGKLSLFQEEAPAARLIPCPPQGEVLLTTPTLQPGIVNKP